MGGLVMALTESQVAYVQQQQRDAARQCEEAYRHAARETARTVETIRVHIERRNYGLADDWLVDLLASLPHDHGAQEFYPLYDDALEAMQARRIAEGRD